MPHYQFFLFQIFKNLKIWQHICERSSFQKPIKKKRHSKTKKKVSLHWIFLLVIYIPTFSQPMGWTWIHQERNFFCLMLDLLRSLFVDTTVAHYTLQCTILMIRTTRPSSCLTTRVQLLLFWAILFIALKKI